MPAKLVKLGVSSADQAVALLEDDIEGTVEELYAEEEVTAADLEELKAAACALRSTAFAGKRRRRYMDPRTADLLYCVEEEKARRASESKECLATHPIDPESRQCRASGRGSGIVSGLLAEAKVVEGDRR